MMPLMDCVIMISMPNLAFAHVAFSDHVAKPRAIDQHVKLDTKTRYQTQKPPHRTEKCACAVLCQRDDSGLKLDTKPENIFAFPFPYHLKTLQCM